MSNQLSITVVGNLTADPELRFTPAGHAVCNFTVAHTPRSFNKQSNEWVEGEPLFLRCSLWREAAENAAETLSKGMRVIAQGRLSVRQYETKDGRTGTSVELAVDEIGPSLRFASAQVTRNAAGRGGGNFGGGQQASGFAGGQQGFGSQQAAEWTQQQQQDPWGGGGGHDEPPF